VIGAGDNRIEGPNTAAYDKGLKAKTRRSIGWLLGETVVEQIFSFLIFVLMARVLPMEDLGTFAIIFVIMDIGRTVAMAGVFQRVARAKDLSPMQLDTIFWINVALGLLYCLAMLAFANLAQSFLRAPLLEPVTQWMTLALFVAALGNTHMALRLREFGHRTLALRSLIAGLLGAAVAVGGVLTGWGIWAFVAQRITREVVVTLFAWNSVSWRPRFSFDVDQARSDISFGKDIVAAQLIGYLTFRAQDLLIARFHGPVVLSIYRVAWRSAELLGPQLVSTFSIVSLQTFSRLQDDKVELRRAYLSLLRNCALLTVPALVGYASAAPWLVPAIFGHQWYEAGRVAVPLGLLAIPFATTYFCQAALTALGHAAWQRQLAIGDMISVVLVGLLAVRFDLMWVVIAYTLRAYIWLPVQIHLLRRVANIGFRDHLGAFAPALGASAVMAGAVSLSLTSLDTSSLPVVGLVCLGGAIFYGATVWAIFPRARAALISVLRRFRCSQ
jgi:O-antigen/teichoic acid export membrane protein